MPVKILTDRSGACPHSPEGVKLLKNNEFVIYPQFRHKTGRGEELAGGARLEIQIENSGSKTEEIILNIDWKVPENLEHTVRKYHDFCYFASDDGKWKVVFADDVNETLARFILKVEPGISSFAHYPAYNLEELGSDIKKWSKKGAVAGSYGKSDKGKELPFVSFGTKGKEKLIILARSHAYETAGSYCARGIASFLLSDENMAKYILSRFHVILLPMTNPDGVEDGMSRFTSCDGADLNRYMTRPDAAHKALIEFLDSEKPELLINYHNWQDKFIDGMWCVNKFYEAAIKYYLSDFHNDYKRIRSWTPSGKKINFAFEVGSVQDYLEDRYKTITATFEFPWFNRDTDRMEEVGKKSLLAFLMARIEEKDSLGKSDWMA